MVAERGSRCTVEQSHSPGDGRQLRNWLIAGNLVAWIIIIVVIRLLF